MFLIFFWQPRTCQSHLYYLSWWTVLSSLKPVLSRYLVKVTLKSVDPDVFFSLVSWTSVLVLLFSKMSLPAHQPKSYIIPLLTVTLVAFEVCLHVLKLSNIIHLEKQKSLCLRVGMLFVLKYICISFSASFCCCLYVCHFSNVSEEQSTPVELLLLYIAFYISVILF